MEYKTIVLGPEGLRIKGDDNSKNLAVLLEKKLNVVGKEGWKAISIVPSMVSEGAVVKLIVTFEKHNA